METGILSLSSRLAGFGRPTYHHEKASGYYTRDDVFSILILHFSVLVGHDKTPKGPVSPYLTMQPSLYIILASTTGLLQRLHHYQMPFPSPQHGEEGPHTQSALLLLLPVPVGLEHTPGTPAEVQPHLSPLSPLSKSISFPSCTEANRTLSCKLPRGQVDRAASSILSKQAVHCCLFPRMEVGG